MKSDQALIEKMREHLAVIEAGLSLLDGAPARNPEPAAKHAREIFVELDDLRICMKTLRARYEERLAYATKVARRKP